MILGLACGGGRGGAPEPTGLAAREASFGAASSFVGSGDVYRASLSLPFTQSVEEGIDRIDISLGGEALDMVCYFYGEEIDLGVSALIVAQLQVEHIETQLGEFERRELSDLRGGVIGDAAFHALELTLNDSAKGASQIKAAAANKQGLGAVCIDINLGYRETFERVFEELVGSLAPTRAPPALDFREVLVMTLGGLPVSVSDVRFRQAEDGNVEVVGLDSTLIPRGGLDLLATFSRRSAWARPDGTLISGLSLESDIEDVVTRLEIRPDDAGGWHVQGVFQRKALSGSLDHVGPLHTVLSEYRGPRKELVPRGDATRLELVRWMPEIDPLSAQAAILEVDPADSTRMTVNAAGITIQAQRSPEGWLQSGSAELGPTRMRVEVVYRSGDL